MNLYKKPYTIAVSIDGSGDFDTLTDALERVKALQKDTSVAENYDAIVIRLSAGRHLIKETVVIDADMATGTIPVVIEGAKDGETTLDGGVQFVGGWTAYKDGIYQKKIDGVSIFRQLYVNGKVGTRSRFPNVTGNLKEDYLPLTWNEDKATHDTKGCVAIPAFAQKHFSQDALHGAELHFVQEWTQSVGHIWDKGWTLENDVLYFGFSEDWFTRQLFTRPYPIRNGVTNRCWVENSLAFLDAENEWFFDKDTSTLYYKPEKGVDVNSLTFEIPQTESIIKILGTPQKQAKKVAIVGVTVANTNWSYVSKKGYIDGQAGLFYAEGSDTFGEKSPSAGIYALYARDILIDNCVIKQTGAYGVDFHVGTKNAKLLNSTVEKTAGSGVNIGRYYETDFPEGYVTDPYLPSTQEEITEEITVYNNLIQKIGTAFKGGSTGIVAGFARKITLEQNTITDVSYSGIAVGWGWEHLNSVLCNIKINKNHITNTMNHLPFDGGPIYLVGKHVKTEDGSQIQDNYMEASGLGGIYFDNSSSEYAVKNNVIKGEGLQGIIDLHDWNYLLQNITVVNTYSDLQTPVKGVNRHHYWHATLMPSDDAPTPASRGVIYEPHIWAYKDGKWSKEAQAIIDKAGQIQK